MGQGVVLQKSESTAISIRCHHEDGYQASALALRCDETLDGLAEDVSYLREIRSAANFAHLAQGGVQLGASAVKFLIDLERDDRIYFTRTSDWDLHYQFVRSEIREQLPLDRCDEEDAQRFRQGWWDFSATEYDASDDRRFLMGTLVHYAGSNFFAIEFATGDEISATLMRRVYEVLKESVYNSHQYYLLPRSSEHIDKVRSIEGTVPARGPNAPFVDVDYQILNPGVSYGYLREVPAAQFSSRRNDSKDIIYTDFVPADLPAVRGLITSAFQTPLSHVNILSRNRGTPNLVLRDRDNPVKIDSLIGKLIRLEVREDGFDITEGNLAEAQAAWGESKTVQSPRINRARIDSDGTPIDAATDIDQIRYSDLPTFGGKAVQFAELMRLSADPRCAGSLSIPEQAIAIPIYVYLDHVQSSGAGTLIDQLANEPDDKRVTETLFRIRGLIMDNQIKAEVIDRIYTEVQQRFSDQRVRFRSSSNTEDLPGFNGAGLYDSVGVDAAEGKDGIVEAIRTVWASLWTKRAFDERRYFGVDESTVAMGVLIHAAIQGEVANGVAVSRDVLNPIRGDVYYVNAQRGNASVVQPANQTVAEQFSYRWYRSPRQIFHARSSFVDEGNVVLSPAQVDALACHVRRIHDHFAPIIDPTSADPYFAMDVEFKFLGSATDDLIIKQARPYAFTDVLRFDDCREFM